MAETAAGHRRITATAWPVPAAALAGFIVLSLVVLLTTPFPAAFDENQHLSYAAFLQEHHLWLPDFARQTLLSTQDPRQWTDTPNYVGHPSPFYLYVGLFLDRSLSSGWFAVPPRLASTALLWIGLALCLTAATRRFRGDERALLLFCLALAGVPKLLAIGAQVSNDSLGFLGGALTYAALALPTTPSLLGLGVALAVCAKVNAGLVVVAMGGICLWLRGELPTRRGVMLAVGALVGSTPYFAMLHDYGALVPVMVEQFPKVPQVLYYQGSVASFIPRFLLMLALTWPYEQTGSWVPVLPFAALLSCMGRAAVLSWHDRRAPDQSLAIAAVLAFILVLPVQFAYDVTVLHKSLSGASFRYFLPLWPGLAHSLALGVMAAPTAWQRLVPFATGLLALAVGWIVF